MQLKQISAKQIRYIQKLVDEAVFKKIELKTKVNLDKLKFISSQKANEIIKSLKIELGKKITPVINQTRKDKDLSNIPLKKEWIVDSDYGTNSVLFLIPDYKNQRYLEVMMPKGDVQTEVENDDGDWVIKNTGRLIYNAKTKYYKEALELNEYLICGVKLTWEKHFRWIPFDETQPIPKKERTKFVDFLEFFEEIVADYHATLDLRKSQIMKKIVARHRNRNEKSKKDSLKISIYNLPEKIESSKWNSAQDEINVKKSYQVSEEVSEEDYKALWGD